MTLGELFDNLESNPLFAMLYFIIIPFFALSLLFIAKGKGKESPWNYLYCTIIYLSSVPAIFSLTLLVYQIVFENMPVEEINIITHILPIASGLLTIFFVRKNVSLDDVPGFGKLSGLLILILILLSLMWILDKTRIIVFTGFPFYYVLILLIALFVISRYALKKITTSNNSVKT